MTITFLFPNSGAQLSGGLKVVCEYARKLDLLMSDEKLRMRMATKGRESTKRFEPEGIAQKWIELFQHIDSNNLVF